MAGQTLTIKVDAAEALAVVRKILEDGLELFIVGQLLGDEAHWDFQGVFSNRELAEAVCLDSRFFVAPAMLNHALPEESSDWPGLYFPNDSPPPRGKEVAAKRDEDGERYRWLRDKAEQGAVSTRLPLYRCHYVIVPEPIGTGLSFDAAVDAARAAT